MKTFFDDRNIKKEWIWALLVLTLIFSIAFKKIIEHPNQFLVSGGDGMKNYYTFMYHVKYDTTLMTFEGMNYPFGENIIFTDNQPLLSNSTKIISKVFPSVLCNLPAIHNLALLFGLILGSLGLFLCFRMLKVNFIFALLCTIGLTFMHPQLERMGSHFAMFYPILPWIFLFWLKIWDEKSIIKNSGIIGGIILMSGLLHMYFFITSAILCCFALFFTFLSSDKKYSLKQVITMFLLQVIVPFISLQFFTTFFNGANDRPNSPYGFFSYHSYWEGLFFSYKLPLYKFINKNIIHIRDFDAEGKSYIGILAVIFCIYGLYKLVLSFKSTSSFFKLKSTNGRLIWIFILSAFVAFGYPFTISGLNWMLDYTGPFKQFRSIGRVAWVSFYAINLIVIPTVFHWLKSKKWGIKSEILYYAIPMVIIIEGFSFFKSREINQTPISAYYCDNEYKNFPIKGEDYQALLPDPYFSIGSECFSWWDQGFNVNQSFELGFNLHLPTMGSNMSRTSLHQAMLLNELVCQPYRVPAIINLLKQKDNRPLLVIESKLDIHEHRAKLSHWTKGAPIVYETDAYKLRRLELNDFSSIVDQYKLQLDSIKTVQPDARKISVDFKKAKGQNGWGYEFSMPIDTSINGSFKLSYWIDCTSASIVGAISEIWQFDINHNNLEYIGEANRFNYKQIDGNKLLIEIPINLKSETAKLVIRISKERQKENEQLNISDAQLIKN